MKQSIVKPVCTYCSKPAELVDGTRIYPRRTDLRAQKYWLCSCGAYVGTHAGTTIPLGTLANAKLRRLRAQAHGAFDPLWRSTELSRTEAYAWLAVSLGIDIEECHIGMFDEAMCRAVIFVCASAP